MPILAQCVDTENAPVQPGKMLSLTFLDKFNLDLMMTPPEEDLKIIQGVTSSKRLIYFRLAGGGAQDFTCMKLSV